MGIFSILFLPGVFLHEFSHFVMAKILRVRTGKFSIFPQSLPDGRLQLGYVETAPIGYRPRFVDRRRAADRWDAFCCLCGNLPFADARPVGCLPQWTTQPVLDGDTRPAASARIFISGSTLPLQSAAP